MPGNEGGLVVVWLPVESCVKEGRRKCMTSLSELSWLV